jgi:hypothetical protein
VAVACYLGRYAPSCPRLWLVPSSLMACLLSHPRSRLHCWKLPSHDTSPAQPKPIKCSFRPRTLVLTSILMVLSLPKRKSGLRIKKTTFHKIYCTRVNKRVRTRPCAIVLLMSVFFCFSRG